MKIYGLTLKQPWAFGFVLGKRVENRDWLPPKSFGSFWIALHGGKTPKAGTSDHDEAVEALHWIFTQTESYMKCENEIREKYAQMFLEDEPLSTFCRERIFGIARFVGSTTGYQQLTHTDFDSQIQWANKSSTYQWLLDEVHFLSQKNVIPCRGYQKLWNINPVEEAKLKRQFPLLEVSR